MGPLSFRSQGPGQILRLTPIPRGPRVLAAGRHEFRAVGAVSSIYARDTGYHVDMHLADTRVSVAAGLGGCWDLEVGIDERGIVNAHLDDITLAFHRWFGFDDAGQDSAPRNATDVRFPRYGVALTRRDRGPFSRSVELTLSRLFPATKPHAPLLGISFAVRRETLTSEGGDEPGTDFGVTVSAEQSLGENRLYGNLSYIQFGTNRYLGIPLEDHQSAAAFIYEWRRGERFSWLGQYLYTDGVMQGLGPLDQPSHEVHLGAKWRAGGLILEAALIENVIVYNNGPDFGFAFGLKAPF